MIIITTSSIVLYCDLRFDGTRRVKIIFSVVRKRNKTSSCIRKLLMEDGQEITNPEHIRKEIKSFYENLYTK